MCLGKLLNKRPFFTFKQKWKKINQSWVYKALHLPLKCFGQQTNSTPENNEIPHGNNIAKLLICIPRSWQAVAPVWFHRTNGQHLEALWMWSKRQPSGTKRASDWNGPSRHLNGLIHLWAPLHLAAFRAPWRHQPPIFW